MSVVNDLTVMMVSAVLFSTVLIFCYRTGAPFGALPAALIFFSIVEERLK